MCLFKWLRKKKKDEPKAEVKSEKKASAVKVEEEKPVKAKAKAPAKEEAATAKTVKEKKTAPKAEAKAPKAEASADAKPADEKPADDKSADQRSAITGRFEIKKSKDDRYVFNLFASNQLVVASSQTYSSAQAALQGINSVINNAESAPIEDQTLKNFETKNYPKWEIYKDKGDEFRFRLNASNGQTICHSQGYTTKANCKKGIDSIIRSSRNAEIDKAYLED